MRRSATPAPSALAPPQSPSARRGLLFGTRNRDLGHLCVSRFALEIVCLQASHPVGWPPRLGPGLLARWLGPQLNFRFSGNTRAFPEYTPTAEIRKTAPTGAAFHPEQDCTGRGRPPAAPFDSSSANPYLRRMKCLCCEDTGWVCENHPDQPWEGPHACSCGGAWMLQAIHYTIHVTD
jgi:hypothetical protein